MNKLLTTIILLCLSLHAVGQPQQEVEAQMQISEQTARCIGYIFGIAANDTERKEMTEKLYKHSVATMTKAVDTLLDIDDESNSIRDMLVWFGDKQVLVGVMLGQMLSRNSQAHFERIRTEGAGRTSEEMNREWWAEGGCDALYSLL